jgi:hypothetical protein
VTSHGHPHRQFAAALEARNYPVAFVLARELAPLSLEDALSLLAGSLRKTRTGLSTPRCAGLSDF